MSDIIKHKKFLQAQTDITNLIPKSKQNSIYDGLKTKLHKAIDEYINESCETERQVYKKQIIALRDEIYELKTELGHYTPNAEDVYPSGSGKKGE